MKSITHNKQRKIWEEEHRKPKALKQMDSTQASSGVIRFFDWLKNNGYEQGLKGIEMGCGKGRNVIWLAKKGFHMTGFDFSGYAIREANLRVKKYKASSQVKLLVHDAIRKWPFKSKEFDMGIDCFATTDIETVMGRKFAASELIRVVKSGGVILVYVMSIDDEYHRGMIRKSPAEEKNAFLNPITGKFEKTFDRSEILDLYDQKVKLLDEFRVEKFENFFGKNYKCKHFWMIFQKN